jgi:peptidoglycan/LPS O-acetylase OafA/YrhL
MADRLATEGSDGFRPDVEGLRGVAVLAVVLFHAGLGGLGGGFVGVDVFFVISGFLITGLLVREHTRTGTIRLSAFYARRVRRLLPAALAVLVVTLAAAMVLVAPLDRPSVAADASAAALSVANIRFAVAAGDYFTTLTTPSPFLHYWSLGVEEQFYLVWPALILLVARGAAPARRLGFVLVAISAIAFAGSVWLTDQAPSWAFYSLPTRAWQLGLGGLLAIGGSRLVTRFPRLTVIAGWAGLGLVVTTAFVYASTMPYPGVAAAVPTVATAAVLLGGAGRFGPGVVLGTLPLRFLGRISYSLYLWHWPVFALAPLALGAQPDALTSLALVGASIALATASYAVIETPFRRGIGAARLRPGRTVSIGLAAMAAVVLLASGLSVSAGTFGATGASAGTADATPSDESADAWSDATPQPVPPEELASDDGNVPPPDGGPSADPPSDTPTPDPPTATPAPATVPPATGAPGPGATPTAAPAPHAGPIPLRPDVTPSLVMARGDEDRLRSDGCIAFENATAPRSCVYGDPGAAYTVALVGDSHAAQWFPALERIAQRKDWKIVVLAKVSCPFTDIPVVNLSLKREYRECAAWNAAVVDRLHALQPDLTLIEGSRTAAPPVSAADNTPAARGHALARMVAQLDGKVALIVDTPFVGFDMPGCLSSHVDDVRRCAIPRWIAFTGSLGRAERIAAAATGALLVDLTGNICPGKGACPAVVANHIVYRDLGHLTKTFARSLAPVLAAALAPLTDKP